MPKNRSSKLFNLEKQSGTYIMFLGYLTTNW